MTTEQPNGQGPEDGGEVVVSIRNVTAQLGDTPGQFVVTLETNHGDIEAVFLPCEGKTGCVIFIGDEGAQGVYRQLSEDLITSGVTSLRLRPRVTGEFTDTLIDTLAACSFLKGLGGESAVIVGHSYA